MRRDFLLVAEEINEISDAMIQFESLRINTFNAFATSDLELRNATFGKRHADIKRFPQGESNARRLSQIDARALLASERAVLFTNSTKSTNEKIF